VAGLTALTLLHLSECSSVTVDGMRAMATSLTHIESAGTPARVREMHWRVMRGVRHGGAAWGLVMQYCGIAAAVTWLG
jgi:aspartate aminotransferase-like enzyme